MLELENDLLDKTTYPPFVIEVLKDYRVCCISREVSLLGRKEVLTGKAKFGILGDGKEIPQVALARVFKEGDFRSGYYRDQTWMLAAGVTTIEDFFAQLYADPNNDPFSSGRQMNSHFATPFVDKNGEWTEQKSRKNVSSDISPTGGQMARALGLALASKKYRESAELQDTKFSNKGNEVCFCTIGDASTSEGVFWETINAAGVMQVPLAVFVWDDGYGISVPTKYQTTKGSISEALAGFQSDKTGGGYDMYVVKGWDYANLCEVFEKGIDKVRKEHKPAIFHVKELTQVQGHSTSGSHERYKSKERLAWEKEHDCLQVMRKWILDNGLAVQTDLEAIEKEAKRYVREAKNRAWQNFLEPIKANLKKVVGIYDRLMVAHLEYRQKIKLTKSILNNLIDPLNRNLVSSTKSLLRLLKKEQSLVKTELIQWLENQLESSKKCYTSNLYSENQYSALNVAEVAAEYDENPPKKNGYEILNTFFDKTFAKHDNVFAFGEDVGYIGDVNQGFAGLQEKYGEHRIFDTGIREWTIMGQGLGMAMRGLRPIAEIQYLDYMLYGLVPLSDDVATLRYRTNGLQQAPLIVRTRGHRLEGIWHSGSPISMLINAVRGICVLVPRNMVQAAGMYNTMLQSNDPAIIIECLNGYRLKELMPNNLNEFTVPLGTPEVMQEGTDVTLVTYGSCVRIAQEGIKQLEEHGISVELIDVQSLLPFDVNHLIVDSLQKTNRIVFMDEDVIGGATAYMMQQVLEGQNGYQYLDSSPKTIAAGHTRAPYGSEGDYVVKPVAENVFETIYDLMTETNPSRFPKIW